MTPKASWPGLNVTCEIATVDKSGVLLAPMEAIKPDRDDNLMVFVIDTESNRIEQRRIEADKFRYERRDT